MKANKKIIAILMIILLLGTNLLTLGNQVKAAITPNQNSKTNNSNVEFNSYFEDETHTKTSDINNIINLYLKINVKNAGYLKNAIINISNANFQIDYENLNNEMIQNATETSISLKQIKNNQETIIEVPIKLKEQTQIENDFLEKISQIDFTANYVDENGKEKLIEKTIYNQVIWNAQAQLQIFEKETKYIPYKQNEEYGVLLQTVISSEIKDHILPILKTELNMQVPQIEGQNPQRVNVFTNQTSSNNTKISTSYNEQTGKLSIKNEEQNGVINWSKNGQDEYVLNFIYVGKEIYSKLNQSMEIEAKVSIPTKNEEIINQKININYENAQKQENLTDVTILAPENIYKGYMYANYDKNQNQEKSETPFEIAYRVQVNDANLTNKITIQTMLEQYLDENQNEYTLENNSYIKQIKIAKSNFEQILSEEGTIEITKKDGSKITSINKQTNQDENQNYVVNIQEQNINEIIIVASKPQSAGNLEITLEKAIKEETNYNKNQMQSFSKVSTGIVVEEQIKKANITLKEPVSKAKISLANEKQNLSTMVENKDVEMRIQLDTSGAQKALYKNPVFEIELPSEVEKVTIKDIKLLLEDELKIKEAKVIEKNVIQIELEGTQTEYKNIINTYSENIISSGANIILHVDITLNKFIASKTEKIVMRYTNQNTNLYEIEQKQDENKNIVTAKATKYMAEQTIGQTFTIQNNNQTENIAIANEGIATTSLNLVAPAGIVTLNSISGYNNENQELMSLKDEKQNVTIQTGEEKHILTIKGIVTNNYTNSIENVAILGRIPYEGNKQIDTENSLDSNFTMKMTKKLELNGIEENKVKIYYSTNGEASKDLINSANGWTENIDDMSAIKSYLIMITTPINQGEQIGFNYQVELPENLKTGSSSYQTYKVYYDNKTQTATIGETKQAATLGIVTKQTPKLEVNLSSNIEQNGIVTDEQIVKFTATVKNTGNSQAQNVSLNIVVPEGATYTKYNQADQEYVDSNENVINVSLGNLEPEETKQINYELKMKPQGSEKFAHQVNVTANDLENAINSNTYELNKTATKLNMTLYLPRDQETNLNKGDILYATLILEARQELKNVVVNLEIPNGITIKEASYQDENTQIQNDYVKIQNGKITAQIPNMKADYLHSIKITMQVENFTGDFKFISTGSADGLETVSSNELLYHVGIPNFEITQNAASTKYVKEAQEIIYEFNIKNVGDQVAQDVVFENELPQGLTFKKLQYTYEGNTQIITATLNNTAKVRMSNFASGAEATVQVIAVADLLPQDKNDKTVSNVGYVSAQGIDKKESNQITTVIEYNEKLYEGDEGNKETNGKPGSQTKGKYRITGTAWLDENKNGQREENEQVLSGIKVMLMQTSNGQVVKDINSGEEKQEITKQDGSYEFNNLSKGEYIVIFLYDASKYSITEYQKQDVSQSYNSDAIAMNITLDGEKRIAGITNNIKITDEVIRDIDLGLYEAKKFDLRLDKTISKITLTTPTIGTKAYTYNNTKLAKIEVLGSNVNKSSIVVEYKIKVTNEGQVAGYVKKIIDYLPEDAKFSSELNSSWYLANNNSAVYNTSLENTLINPGESKEVTLILSMQITDKNIATIINNNAEIYESYNEQGLQDIDSEDANKIQNEDDISNADIMLGVVTGKIVIYSTLILAIAFIFIIGIITIQRKVLAKK